MSLEWRKGVPPRLISMTMTAADVITANAVKTMYSSGKVGFSSPSVAVAVGVEVAEGVNPGATAFHSEGIVT